MKRLFLITAAVLVVAAVGCAPRVDIEAERAAIHKFHDECLAAMLIGDVGCFAEDGLALPHDALPIAGRDAIGELISKMIEDPNLAVSHDIVNLDISAGGDQAYLHYTYDLTMSDPSGNPATEHGKGVFILKKQSQIGWEILIDIWNADSVEIDTESEVQAGFNDKAAVPAILALEQDVFDAQNAGDFEGWLSFFTDDVLIMPPNEPVLRGKAAVRAHNLPLFQEFDLHEETDEREVEVAGNWGYIRAHWKWTLTPKNGDEAITDIGSSIWIVRRQAGGNWKISRGIYNSDVPRKAP